MRREAARLSPSPYQKTPTAAAHQSRASNLGTARGIACCAHGDQRTSDVRAWRGAVAPRRRCTSGFLMVLCMRGMPTCRAM